jgi:acetoin utilization deacetylase AcuC-like enzyme
LENYFLAYLVLAYLVYSFYSIIKTLEFFMLPTGIVYSNRFTNHITPFGHPERPERVVVISEVLKKANFDLLWIEPRLASIEQIALCHEEAYIRLVQREVLALAGTQSIRMLTTGDVTISAGSFDTASLAVGAVFDAVDTVMQGKVKNAFVIPRPPGHHATKNRGMGFCLFNNVACGVRYLQQNYAVERVLIIDWDLHHGNGTEDIFAENPNVLYFSTHQAGIYPGTGWEMTKSLCNCPITAGKGSRDAIFEAFTKVLEKRLEEFKPQFIFISAGFDAHMDDPLGELALTETDFYVLTQLVLGFAKKWAHGRVVSVLEGGYNLKALEKSALEHVRGLVGE